MRWLRSRYVWLGGAFAFSAGIFGILAANGQTNQDALKAGQLAGRNAQLYGYQGVVSGRVTYANGTPASGYRVEAQFTRGMTGAQGEGYAITDASGNYAIRGLARIDFHIVLDNQEKPFLARVRSQTVTLTERNPTASGIDFVLDPGAEITVRVRDAETDAPIPGFSVTANSVQPAGVTDANGEFVYRSTTRSVTLQLDAEHQGNPIHGAAPGYGFYFQKTLAPGTKTVWDVKTYRDPHTWQLPRTFHGTVIGIDGKPVYGATVRLLRETSVLPNLRAQTRTNSGGAFAFDTFRASGDGAVILVREHGSDIETAHPLRAADTWKPLVIRLSPVNTATVTGIATDPNGDPLAGVPISYNAQFVPTSPTQSDMRREEFGTGGNADATDAQGRFTIRGLHSQAVYYFTFGRAYQNGNPQGFGTTLYPADCRTTFKWVRLTAGETRDIGKIVVHRADGTVSGKLVDADGNPLSKNLAIVVTGKHTYQHGDIKQDGSFLVRGLVQEPLRLLVFYVTDGGYGGGETSPDCALARSVQCGDADIRLVVPPDTRVKKQL